MTIASRINTDRVIHDLNGHPAIVERLEELQEQRLALSAARRFSSITSPS